MIKTGLVSITFRELSPAEVISLVKEAGIDAIEWGGDIHVPHGDIQKACEIRKSCENSNILTPSYGSYYRAGVSEEECLSFNSVLETAKALGSGTVRVWAGNQASESIDCESRKKIVNDLIRIANLAEHEGISISLEYHANTLTDSDESSKQLISELTHSNIFFYWQPPNGKPVDHCMATLKTVIPYLSNLHVFHWEIDEDGKRIRLPLKDGIEKWKKYLSFVAAHTDKCARYAMIEFVSDGTPKQFLEDAGILKQLIGNWKLMSFSRKRGIIET